MSAAANQGGGFERGLRQLWPVPGAGHEGQSSTFGMEGRNAIVIFDSTWVGQSAKGMRRPAGLWVRILFHQVRQHARQTFAYTAKLAVWGRGVAGMNKLVATL